MKHFEKKTKEKKKKIPGKKALTELLNTKNGGGDVWGEVGIAQSLIAKKIKPKKRGKDKTSGEPLSIVAFIKQFPKVRNTVLLIAAEEAEKIYQSHDSLSFASALSLFLALALALALSPSRSLIFAEFFRSPVCPPSSLSLTLVLYPLSLTHTLVLPPSISPTHPQMIIVHEEKTASWVAENPDATGEEQEVFWFRKPVPPTPAKFVDSETGQQMNIGLSRGFPEFDQIALALETFDLDILKVEFVTKLSAWDLDSLRLKGQEHKGDPPELIARADRAEQLCIALADVKKIRQRLKIMMFIGKIDDDIERCQTQTQTVLKATQQFLTAVQFPKFIKIARDVINRINAGTSVGAVQGLPLNQVRLSLASLFLHNMTE